VAFFPTRLRLNKKTIKFLFLLVFKKQTNPNHFVLSSLFKLFENDSTTKVLHKLLNLQYWISFKNIEFLHLLRKVEKGSIELHDFLDSFFFFWLKTFFLFRALWW